ncbi:YebC/PmpR family DNA-binding transcriptional regulator [Chlamydiia bacterium]|nr:YebC/PmpR family DNA-binding transcriptional regulator [Chlamydiia bacterium]
MAGHSKWSNIKHKKAKNDEKKGKIFSRLAKEIITAVKLSGADISSNPRLRLALQKAKAANMPNENVQRNIKKAQNTDVKLMDAIYEVYGSGGVGVIIEGMTDNKNRLNSSIREAIKKTNGVIGNQGSVAHSFNKLGVVTIDKENISDYQMIDLMEVECIIDILDLLGQHSIQCEHSKLTVVTDWLEKQAIPFASADICWMPTVYVTCNQEDTEANNLLFERLDDVEDVDVVYHNMSMEDS